MPESFHAFLAGLPEELHVKAKERFPGGFTTRDEANALVVLAFRNGPLEDLHAGQPSALLDNPELSRITDDEMKALMISACRCLEGLLREKETDPDAYRLKIFQANWMYCRGWER